MLETIICWCHLFMISSFLATLDSQLFIIQLTSIPLILGSITLLTIRLYPTFYLPFLDLVTTIHPFLFSWITELASVWLEWSVKSQSMTPYKTLLFLTFYLPVSTSCQSSSSVILSACLACSASEKLFVIVSSGFYLLLIRLMSTSLCSEMSIRKG